MSTWLRSNRAAAGSKSFPSAAKLTITMRVQTMWSSHSARMLSWRTVAFLLVASCACDDECSCPLAETVTAMAATAAARTTASLRVIGEVMFLSLLFVDEQEPDGAEADELDGLGRQTEGVRRFALERAHPAAIATSAIAASTNAPARADSSPI